MSEFYGYEKMPENFKNLIKNEEQAKSFSKLKWVVTEKVHGANFSWNFTDGIISYAKRKEVLEWSEDFFGYQTMVAGNEGKLTELFSDLRSAFDFSKATVYGELFGGAYPHPEVEADQRLQAIQTGVYYCPHIEFYAFDIALETPQGQRYYLDYDKAVNYFKSHDIVHAKILFAGNLSEAMDYDIEFESFIPASLGLPKITANNLAEGIVIKPLKHLGLINGERPILKIKNKKFIEERFHEAEKWTFDNNSDELTIEFILPELINLITINRLNAVISKIGRPEKSDLKRMEEIEQLMIGDVIESFETKFGSLLKEFSFRETERLKLKLLLLIRHLLHQSEWMR